MNIVVYIGADWIYYFFRVLFCFKYMELLFLKNGKAQVIPYISAGILASADAANYFTMRGIFSNTMLLVITCASAILCCYYYKGKNSEKIGLTVLYYIMTQFLDLIATTILFMALGKAIVSQSAVRCVFLIGSVFIWTFLYFIFRHPISNFRGNASTLWMLAFDIIGLLAIIYFQRIYLAEQLEGMIFAWLFFALYSAFMFCLLALYIFRQESRRKLSVVELKGEMLEKNYNNLLLLYKENARLFHDFKAHFRTLRNYLQNQEIEKGIEYIDQAVGPMRKMDELVWTGNKLIDLILNCKRLEAKENGLVVNIQADTLKNVAIPDSDLCVIFSNLLDNAIENCGGNQTIEITVKQRNHLLIFIIRNPIKRIQNTDELKTWKDNKSLHGIGLESVKLSVERNQGNFEYGSQEGIFESLVMLQIDTDQGQNLTD